MNRGDDMHDKTHLTMQPATQNNNNVFRVYLTLSFSRSVVHSNGSHRRSRLLLTCMSAMEFLVLLLNRPRNKWSARPKEKKPLELDSHAVKDEFPTTWCAG